MLLCYVIPSTHSIIKREKEYFEYSRLLLAAKLTSSCSYFIIFCRRPLARDLVKHAFKLPRAPVLKSRLLLLLLLVCGLSVLVVRHRCQCPACVLGHGPDHDAIVYLRTTLRIRYKYEHIDE